MSRFERDNSLRWNPILAEPGRRFSRRSGNPLVRLLDLLLEWQGRAAERYHLATLDDRMLKDTGLDRADVAREIRKPFWLA